MVWKSLDTFYHNIVYIISIFVCKWYNFILFVFLNVALKHINTVQTLQFKINPLISANLINHTNTNNIHISLITTNSLNDWMNHVIANSSYSYLSECWLTWASSSSFSWPSLCSTSWVSLLFDLQLEELCELIFLGGLLCQGWFCCWHRASNFLRICSTCEQDYWMQIVGLCVIFGLIYEINIHCRGHFHPCRRSSCN